MQGEYIFYDAQLNPLETRQAPEYRFDPRTRNWFQPENPGIVVTPPYHFKTDNMVGVSFSQRANNKQAIAGVDIRLSRLMQMLKQAKSSPDSRIALITEKNQVLATSQDIATFMAGERDSLQLMNLLNIQAPELQRLLSLTHQNALDATQFTGVDGESWEGMVSNIRVADRETLRLLMVSPHSELLAEAVRSGKTSFYVSLFLTLLGVFGALWLSRLASRPLQAIYEEVLKIEQFQFDKPIQIRTRIKEIARVVAALNSMKQNISQFMNLSQELASETNFEKLQVRLLQETADQTHATGGILYFEEEGMLQASQLYWHSQAVALPPDQAGISLQSPHILARMLKYKKINGLVSIADFARAFPDLPLPEAPFHALVIPLNNQGGVCLGVLVLFFDTRQQKIHPELQAFAQALAGHTAIALNTQRLISDQKKLLESFIQLMAGAVDAKSPYTGGHCQRVPVIAKQLAEAVCAEPSGPFAQFSLTPGEWEELHIASWLHDCGKVTTPEYVVDKATKLETIYDRIHEVRMRFEVLKRDAEIHYWKGVAEGQEPTSLANVRDETLAQLDADFAFVAECNQGQVFMDAARQQRLQQIASRTWLRTLSDRMGISHDELSRKQIVPEAVLPTQEYLLADKPEQIIARPATDQETAWAEWNFTLPRPADLYNRGELNNLLIARGTLNNEERFKINEHIIQTIIMLESLPFPAHLRHVPEIAGGHHEKVNGQGYPRGLKREQMSVQSRIMAIADIFEALTASDRPYKKSKTLSESIQIMLLMCKDGHIDPALFRVFLHSGVYREYAANYLLAEQQDEVDLPATLATLDAMLSA